MRSPKNSSPNSAITSHRISATSAHERPQDRRQKRRALISAPIRVRTVDPLIQRHPGNRHHFRRFALRNPLPYTAGLLFPRHAGRRGFPYSKSPKAIHTEQKGRIVRDHRAGRRLRGVAITFIAAPVEDHSLAARGRSRGRKRYLRSPAPAETGASKKADGPRR